MAKYFATPIVCDLSSKKGDSLGTSVFKRQYLVGVSFEFADDYDKTINERILIKTSLGDVPIVARNLDGRSGFVDYTGTPLPIGKSRLKLLCSAHQGVRRARAIAWVAGARNSIESM